MISASDRWQHIFGGTEDDAVSKIINAKNGGWITAGYTNSYGDSGYNVFVVRWNEEGKIVWEKVIGNRGDDYGYSAVQDSAGNIFIAGKTNSQGTAGGFDMYLLKLDSSGTILWQHTYGGSGDDFANAILIDSSGDIIMAGGTTSFGAGGSDAYLVKVNSTGTLLWSKNYGSTGDEYANGLAPINTGGFILAGRTTGFSGNEGYVVRTNNSGDSLWTNAYFIGTNNGSLIYDVKELSDSEFIFTGYGGSPTYGNMFQMKTDLNGALSYIQTSHLYGAGFSIITTSDGGYAVAGVYSNFGSFPILTKFTSNGIEQWEQIYYDYNYPNTYNFFAEAHSFVQNIDGSFTLAGSSGLNGTCSGIISANDGYIMKTDSAGFSVHSLSINITANPGTNFCDSANVNVTLSAPLGYSAYQWFNNNCPTRIGGATSQTYHTTDAGVYYCLLISDESVYFTNKVSVSVTLITDTPVVSPSGIVNRCNISIPDDGMLQVPQVTGQNYQWQLNSVPITGAINSYYYPVTDGLYSVNVFNNCGSITSAQTEMHINHGPQNITIVPIGPTHECRQCGQHTYLSSNEKNWSNHYTWVLNNSPISSVSNYYNYLPLISGNYSLIVKNACGVDTSNVITILVDSNSDPVISSSGHSNLTVFNGSGNNIYCGTDTLECSPALNCGSYEWKLNGNILPGTSYQWKATAPGSYTVKIIDSCGTSVTSMPYIVNATQGNDSLIVPNNNSCDYFLLLAPLTTNFNSYQWYRNGGVVSGSSMQNSTTLSGTFYCTFQPAICPAPIPTNTVTLNASLGYVSINATPSNNICSGSILLSVNVANATYVWEKNGTVISGANNQTYAASQTGSYTCFISRPGCDQDSINTRIAIGTNSIVTNSQILCPGSNMYLDLLVPEYFSTFQWRRNGIDLVGDTNNLCNILQSGTYDLRITGSCGSYITNSITITSPQTALTPSGIVPVCDGSIVNFNAPAGPGFKYRWTFGGSNFLDDTGSVLSLSSNALCCGTAFLRAYITIPGVCSYYSTTDTILLLQRVLSNNIYSSTSTEWCGSGSVQLNARIYPGLTYQWYKDSIAIPSATTSSYTGTTNGVYFVSISDSVSCVDKSNTINVKNNYLYGSIATGAYQVLCAGNSTQLTLNSTANTFQWFFDGDSIPGATAQSYIADTTGLYSVSFSNSAGCSGNESTNIFVTPIVPNSIFSTGQNFCSGDTTLLSSTYNSEMNMKWYINGTAISGQNSYQYKATQSGLYFQIGYYNGCSVYSDTIALTFNSAPFANISSAQTSLCNAGVILLLANNGNNMNYQWKINGVDIAGANFINLNVVSSGVYTCEVTGNCGTALSNPITITSPFNAAINVNGTTTFCNGGSVTLNAMPATGGYTYQWRKDNSVIPGGNSGSYFANSSGNYSVTISDANGCVNSSNDISVNVVPNSPSPNLTSSSSYLCPGQHLDLSVDSTNVISYQWKHNGGNISGAVSSVYSAVAAGIYTCAVTNSCGSGISDSVFITLATIPVLSLSADTILCTGSSITLHAGWTGIATYLWQDNSKYEYLILTSSVPDSNLVYVTVTNSSGCLNSDSALVIFEICNGISSVSADDGFVVYPIPARDKLNLYSLKEKMYSVNIIDLIGRNIFSHKFSDELNEINVSSLASGIYFIQINYDNHSYSRKFVKE